MSIWLQDFKSFVQARRLTLRIVILLIILLTLFSNAITLITKEYSLNTNANITGNSFTTIRSITQVEESIDGEAEQAQF